MFRVSVCLSLLLLAVSAFAQPGGEGSSVTDPGPAETAPSPDPAVETEPHRRVRGDRVVVGDTVVVPAGTVHDGEIVCVLGDVIVEGELRGGIVAVGGTVTVSGSIGGDVVSVLSSIRLDPGVRVGGDVINVLGKLSDDGAEVRRGYVDIPMLLPVSGDQRPAAVLGAMLLWLRSTAIVVFVVLVLVLAALAPGRVRAISEAASHRYLAALLLGLAVYLGLPFLIVLLISTLLGIPLVPFALVGFVLLSWLGRAGVLHLIGDRLGRLLGLEPSLPGAVLLGTLLYGLVLLVPLMADGLAGLILHVLLSGAFFLLLDVPAIGLVLLTRGGGSSRGIGGAPEPDGPGPDTTPSSAGDTGATATASTP